MSTELAGRIEARLRSLAAKFSGVEMGHRLPKSDHGSARSLGVTFVNGDGVDVDVADELGEIADMVSELSMPIVDVPAMPIVEDR